MAEDRYDIAIIGCGPAGLQAAIHSASKKAKVIVFGKTRRSSLYKAHVANFCCYKKPIKGKQILDTGRCQAEGFGAAFVQEDIIEIKNENRLFGLVTESGESFTSDALVLSMGVTRKELRVKGEKRLVGRGVSYCVDCDANFFKGMHVAVVGNESAAVTGALTLLSYAKTVTLVCRKLKVIDTLHDRLRHSHVNVIEDTWVKEVLGANEVEGILLKNGEMLRVNGVFVELGAKGALELAANLGVAFDVETFSFIETNKKQETNIPGLYAAGDIAGPPWQIAKAIGDGCVAGIEAAEYVKKLHDS